MNLQLQSSVMSFYAYMLRCSDDSFYVGHTDDLDVRMHCHEQGLMPGYTLTRRPVTLVWHQVFESRDQAFAAERQIKGWSRAKKRALIDGDWQRISELGRRYTHQPVVNGPGASTVATRPSRTSG